MTSTSLLQKFASCFVAGLTFAALILLLGNSGTLPWFPPVIVFSIVGISILLALLFPFVWQAKEKKGLVDSAKIYGILYAFIRYCLAFNMASFGWKKIMGLQFVVPAEIANQPMNRQSGEWLTWFYFGHSLVYGLIIAAIQIGGSVLLLFRKTVLLGAVILFSVLFNLVLINIFYGMNAGALLQSLIVTTGILFLILSDYHQLVQFFRNIVSPSPSPTLKNTSVKNLIKLSAIVLSFLFTLYLKTLIK